MSQPAVQPSALSPQDAEALLFQNEFFILRTAQIAAGRKITRSDDEWSVALSAFWEAVQTYDPQKGALQAYAAVVIRHRIIDHLRRQRARSWEMAVEPAVFGGGAEEDAAGMQRAVEQSLLRSLPETDLAEEISELSALLRRYRIDFFDLPRCCPKARKTRAVCRNAARFVCRIAELLSRLRRTLKLPAAEMEIGVPISRKLLDQFRKYIITSVEIEAGDFPGLQQYLAGKEEA